MLQRAATLQAQYEGKLAYKCQNKATGDLGLIQKMIYADELDGHGGADPVTGVRLFACWNHEPGCYDNNDCHYHKQGLTLDACFMYGPNAISTEEIPFSDNLRDVVINDEVQARSVQDDEGYNIFCRMSFWRRRCVCRRETGVVTERAIYLQGLSSSRIMQKETGKSNLRGEISVV